jgi:hypothetical protein
MEPSVVDPPREEPVQPYAELARRLLSEHAELFRLSTLSISPSRPAWRPQGSSRPRAARRRTPQLTLPLRPRVLDGGDRGADA